MPHPMAAYGGCSVEEDLRQQFRSLWRMSELQYPYDLSVHQVLGELYQTLWD